MIDPRPIVLFRKTDRSAHPGKIVCVGRNYAEHAREMNAPLPERPVLFLKPPSAIIQTGGVVRRPPFSNDLHYEAEMVVLIGTRGKDIPESRATDHIEGYGVGLDMTLRDLQSEAKKKGLPWAIAKGFDTSAPISHFASRDEIEHPNELDITLRVNGELRQNSNTRNMIFSIEEIISYVSSVFTLEAGDLIFTGTPEGVGSALPGDTIRAELQDVGILEVSITA